MGRPRGNIIESPRYLQQLEHKAGSESERQRIRALRLMREQGLSMRAVAEQVGVSERQIRRWWKQYQQGGLQTLRTEKKRGGRRPVRIDARTLDELRQKVLSNELPTLRQAQAWLERTAGITYSISGLCQLLKREMPLGDIENMLRRAGLQRTASMAGSAREPIPERVVRFLNSMPTTANTPDWINALRESLRLVLPDVDRISLSINRQANLRSSHSTEMVFQVTQHASSRGQLRLVSVNTHDSASTQRYAEELLEKSLNNGFPFENYHRPHANDYFYAGITYIGTIFLWRDVNKPPISKQTLALLEQLEPFIIYAITAHIAWFQNSRPTDRSFQIALHRMVQSAGLSQQEQRIVVLQLLGHSYKEIAEILKIQVVTVKKHIKSIYTKTETRSLSELFAKYFTTALPAASRDVAADG